MKQNLFWQKLTLKGEIKKAVDTVEKRESENGCNLRREIPQE